MAFKSVDDRVVSGDEVLSNVQIYKGEHSVTFMRDGKTYNTWSDWGLIPSSPPLKPANSLWSKGVTIDGVNGQEDLVRRQPYHAVNSYALLNEAISNDNPLYIQLNDKFDLNMTAQGSMAFIIADQNTSFFSKQQQILNFLHNQTVSMIFSDDISTSYIVRATVASFESGEKYSSLSINYTVLMERRNQGG